ncbi:ankyrin [Aspergillus campestris IBT 28561]|uniref:Ankyrin n=1 Tax=Aspergillus campestris (strain IBT 28561) TaxID=1392248 RepID=A0A2I1CUB1_ASPC2|nr:ankyrin [Aspergillus campestris IBT 28561]PKY01197.1 ankyrin [Aspergillus campestris IBT 28561]
MTCLLSLPAELHLHIAHGLSTAAINAFSQLNHRLYTTINPYLYRQHIQQHNNSPSIKLNPVIIWATTHDRPETLTKLLAHGVSVPLSSGYNSATTTTTTLLGHPTPIQLTTAPQTTHPITLASQHGHAAIITVLLHHGVDPNYPDRSGRTPLELAVIGNHLSAVDVLLSHGCRLTLHTGNAPYRMTLTELGLAVACGYVDIANRLLDEILARQSDDVEVSRQQEGAALVLAAQAGKEGVVRMLLERGVVATKNAGEWAARNGHWGVVRILASVGGLWNLECLW